MKKMALNMAIVAAVLLALVWTVPAQAEPIVVGNEPISRPLFDPYFEFSEFDYTNIAAVDYMNAIPQNGQLTSFQYYALNTNPFFFFLVDGSFNVQWVSEEITPPGTGSNAYAPANPIPVQSGWTLGAYLMSTGTIPFDLSGGSAVVYLYNEPLPTVGAAFAYEGFSNRTYSFSATLATEEPQPGQTVEVTVVKYLDGKRADAVSAVGNAFPIVATWGTSDNLAGGTDYFDLDPDGFNSSIPYEAKSSVMPVGSFYSVVEDTTQGAVGLNCDGGQFSRLLGYTTGDTVEQAAAAKPTTRAPSLSNLAGNQYVIVWNETCGTGDDDSDCQDNGHHYGNDKGDQHQQPRVGCKQGNNGHHYGNDKGDQHTSR